MQNSIPVSVPNGVPNGDAIKLFRPSSATQLELCSHFERLVTPSPNAQRGNSFHLAIADILKAKQAGKEIRPEMANGFTEQCDWALQIVDEKLEHPWHPRGMGIEEEVTLFEDGEFVTSGTVDLFGPSKADPTRLHVIDWKTGQERDYWAQLAIYAVALVEPHGEAGPEVIDLTLAFVDQQRAFTQTFSRNELRERVDSLIASVRDPASPYYINAYCGYCDCRDSCPAWATERKLVTELDGSASLAEKFSVLKSDPEKLGKFIVAFRRLKNMVEEVEELDKVALGMIQSGAVMPGLTTIKRKGTESIEPSALYDLIKSVERRELDQFLKVNVKAAREVWEECMNLSNGKQIMKIPFPKTKVSEPSEYLALKK